MKNSQRKINDENIHLQKERKNERIYLDFKNEKKKNKIYNHYYYCTIF